MFSPHVTSQTPSKQPQKQSAEHVVEFSPQLVSQKKSPHVQPNPQSVGHVV